MKRIHFIGICGVAMSGLAVACKNNGYKVTGSDAGFFPPVSTYLEKNKINFYPGWHPEKMIEDGAPDLVVVGNFVGSSNPEWLYVQEHQIPYQSYPEFIANNIIKKNSIVAAGTYGKTSTTSLLSFVLKEAGLDPSYMFGGVAVQDNFHSAAITKSDYSVLEGDEYKTANWDPRPKFSLYSPTHLLLTSIEWDHADIYPTEQNYFDTFQTLIQSIPTSGTIVACIDNKNIKQMIQTSAARVITYGKTEADFSYHNLISTKDGLHFTITHADQSYEIKSPLLGDYMAANITGCFALAYTLGIEPGKITEAITKYQGIKRRLEKRYEGEITIIDDIAHSPAKAKSVLQTLRSLYAGKIIAVFEPNTGNRQREAIPGYAHAFEAADEVIVPRLTKIKIADHVVSPPMDGLELRDAIGLTHHHAELIEEDDRLVELIKKNTHPGDVVVFLGSHGWRGMVEMLIEKLKVKSKK